MDNHTGKEICMDNTKKQDIRIVKTRRDLRAALMHLMEKNNFDKINVNEICREALVNRMTFYKHYDDKYDLLNDVLLEIKENIVRRMETSHPQVTIESDALQFTLNLLEALIDECWERRAFIGALNNNELVITMVSTTIEKSINQLLTELNAQRPLRYSIEAQAAALTGAASFLVRYWLKHQPTQTKQLLLSDTKAFFQDLYQSKMMFA